MLSALFACNRDNSDLPAATAAAGKVAFFNLIPGSNGIDLYINGTRQNNNKIIYNQYSGYMSIASGQQAVLFKSDTTRLPLFSPALGATLPTDSSTIFVTGNAASNLIFTRDTARADNINYKPKLRFVNASSDSPAFDIVLNSVLLTGTAYKSISKFARVDTGKVTLRLNLAGTNTTVINSSITLTPNRVYTLFVYGSYTGQSANGLNLGIIANY
jgi:hypothetical protein